VSGNACILFVQRSWIHLFCKPIWISKTSTKLWCFLHIHNLSKLNKMKKALSSNISQFSILTKLFFYLSPPYVLGFHWQSELLILSFALLAMTFLTDRSLVLLHGTIVFHASFRCATLETGLAKLEGSDCQDNRDKARGHLNIHSFNCYLWQNKKDCILMWLLASWTSIICSAVRAMFDLTDNTKKNMWCTLIAIYKLL